jgi:hypothetical protein
LTDATAATDPNADVQAPDWSSIAYDVLCPLCEYNLRGLVTPRCPERGYPFVWAEVTHPDRQPHPYLFEHHPERNWWSYRQTVRGACRPNRFWSTLLPRQTSRPRRMLLYWLIGTILVILVSPTFLLTEVIDGIRINNSYRAQRIAEIKSNPSYRNHIINSEGSVDAYLDNHWPTGMALFNSYLSWGAIRIWYRHRLLPLAVMVPLIWPWLTAAAMMIFQISMRHGRLRPIHLARCALYSIDLSSWAGLFLVGFIVSTLALFVIDYNSSSFVSHELDYTSRQICIWVGLAAIWSTWRMRAACKWYLRFTWPTTTAVATQIIAILAALAILILYDSSLAYDIFGTFGLLSHRRI